MYEFMILVIARTNIDRMVQFVEQMTSELFAFPRKADIHAKNCYSCFWPFADDSRP